MGILPSDAGTSDVFLYCIFFCVAVAFRRGILIARTKPVSSGVYAGGRKNLMTAGYLIGRKNQGSGLVIQFRG